MKLELSNDTAKVRVSENTSYSKHQSSTSTHPSDGISGVSNSPVQITPDVTASSVKKKSVKFDRFVNFFYFNHVIDDNQDGCYTGQKLSLIERCYRQEMDKQARMNGLSFAAGHHGFRDGPMNYNHGLALCEYAKL